MRNSVGSPPGLLWGEAGSVGLRGPLLALFERLDAAMVRLARGFSAEPYAFVPLISAADLRALDYFTSFPHLVTLPVGLDCEPANLEAFRAQNGAEAEGPLLLTRTAPVEAVLAPAACYSIYPALRGLDVAATPQHVTVLGTCFRRESEYSPLRRQWCFRMREIVHIGTGESAQAFLAQGERKVQELAAALGLTLECQAATDPFFDPQRSPRFLHQKLFPTKRELIFEGDLAIGSFNYHRSFFGQTFGLTAAGAPAHTACIAFGIERWLYAIVARYGVDPEAWPVP